MLQLLLLLGVITMLAASMTGDYGSYGGSAGTFFWTSSASPPRRPLASTNPFADDVARRVLPDHQWPFHHAAILDDAVAELDRSADRDYRPHEDLISFLPTVSRQRFLNLIPASDPQAPTLKQFYAIPNEPKFTIGVLRNVKVRSLAENDWSSFMRERYPVAGHKKSASNTQLQKPFNCFQTTSLNDAGWHGEPFNAGVGAFSIRHHHIEVFGENVEPEDQASGVTFTSRSSLAGSHDSATPVVSNVDDGQLRQGKSLFGVALADAGFMSSVLCARKKTGICGSSVKVPFKPQIDLQRESRHVLNVQTQPIYGAMVESHVDKNDVTAPAGYQVIENGNRRESSQPSRFDLKTFLKLSEEDSYNYLKTHNPQSAYLPSKCDDYPGFQKHLSEPCSGFLPYVAENTEDSESELDIPDSVLPLKVSDSDESDNSAKIKRSPPYEQTVLSTTAPNIWQDATETATLLGTTLTSSRHLSKSFTRLRKLVGVAANARRRRRKSSLHKREGTKEQESSIVKARAQTLAREASAVLAGSLGETGRELLDRVKTSSELQARRLASHFLYDSDDDAVSNDAELARPQEPRRAPFTSWLSHWKLPRARTAISQSDSEEEGPSDSGFIGRTRGVLQRLLPQRLMGRSETWTALSEPSGGAERRRTGVGQTARAWLALRLRACAERAPVVGSVLSARGRFPSFACSQQESVPLDATEEAFGGIEGIDDSDSSEDTPPAVAFAARCKIQNCSKSTTESAAKSTINVDEEKVIKRVDRRVARCVPFESARFREESLRPLKDYTSPPVMDSPIDPSLYPSLSYSDSDPP